MGGRAPLGFTPLWFSKQASLLFHAWAYHPLSDSLYQLDVDSYLSVILKLLIVDSFFSQINMHHLSIVYLNRAVILYIKVSLTDSRPISGKKTTVGSCGVPTVFSQHGSNRFLVHKPLLTRVFATDDCVCWYVLCDTWSFVTVILSSFYSWIHAQHCLLYCWHLPSAAVFVWIVELTYSGKRKVPRLNGKCFTRGFKATQWRVVSVSMLYWQVLLVDGLIAIWSVRCVAFDWNRLPLRSLSSVS